MALLILGSRKLSNMDNFGIIYKITNLVNGKLYAGQTIRSLGDRWADHKRDAKNGIDYPLYFAIRKYGIENFTIETVDSAKSLKELNKKEVFWIKILDSLTKNGNGYNIHEGGQNLDGVNNEPTINVTTGLEFISAKEMAKYYNLSYSLTVRLLTGYVGFYNGEVFRYKDENKSRIANIRATFHQLEDKRKNKILCMDTGEIFDSIKTASKKLEVSRTSIGNNLNGLSKKAGGLRFAYSEQKIA